MKLGSDDINGIDPAAPGMPIRRASRGLAMAVLALGASLAAADAMAATYRYSASSNRIYVESGGTAYLSDLKAAVPAAPVDLIDAPNKIWLLRAELVVEDGTELRIHGESVGGDVNELRLQSNAADQGGFISMKAEYGTLSFNATRVTAWNTILGAPDLQQADGRAFIRVRSFLDVDGVTPRESRMDIFDSQMSNLGYPASEAYGLVWKVTGTHPDLFTLVNVHGDIERSKIIGNYVGMYTTGLEAGSVIRTEFANSTKSGIDLHDRSDRVLLRGNNVHHNGDNGIMVTQSRATRLLTNRVAQNAGSGILMTRGSRNGKLTGNRVLNNAEGGIVLFASNGNLVRNNTIQGNMHGVRIAVGGSNNRIDANEIADSSGFGIYVQKDDSVPEPGSDGIPRNNIFTENDVHDAATQGVKVVEAAGTSFVRNTFRNVAGPFYLQFASATTIRDNTMPRDLVVKLLGTASVENTLDVVAQQQMPLEFDAFSRITFTDAGNRIYDVAQNVGATATPTGSTLRVTSAALGSTVATVVRRALWAMPASAEVLVNPTTWDQTTDLRKIWRAQTIGGTPSVQYTVGDLAAAATYEVLRGTTSLGNFVANASGQIAFSDTPPSTAEFTYTVRPL